MASRSDVGLVRAIGARQLTASIINVTIGAGIFVLPAAAAGGLGPAAPLAYVVCAVLMALIVCCFAAAGSRVSLTGGVYAYVEVAFGPFVGFLAGILYMSTATFAVASVSSAFAASVGELWPPAATPAGRAAVIAALFAALASTNVRGVQIGARLVEVITVAKLLPLIVLVVTGIWFINPAYLRWQEAPTPSAVGQTAIVLIFAFVGMEIALVPSGEVRDPARTVPRAVFSALAVTTTLYLLIQVVAQGLLGAQMSTFANAPLAEAAGRVLGRGGRLLVLVGATISMFGYVSGDMLGSPRALFAFARDGVFPSPLARVHPRFHTPYIAIVIYAVIVASVAVSSSFTQLAVLANVAALTLYLACVAASFDLQRRDVRADGDPFEMPGGGVVPLLAAGVIVWLLSNASRREFGVEALLLAVAALFYFIRRTGGRL
ncbi:MAG TPA: APC family permease [Vicinamibacterales bacterium]|nr:APC family permease [Vicinamibacterales bacterium]